MYMRCERLGVWGRTTHRYARGNRSLFVCVCECVCVCVFGAHISTLALKVG
jgi:hypothetical protein